MLNFFASIAHLFESTEKKVEAFLIANKWAVEGLIKWAATFYQENEGHQKLVTVINIIEQFLKIAFLGVYSDTLATKIEEVVQNIYNELKAKGEV